MAMARLSAQAHQRLQRLATKRGESQQEVIEAAIALMERHQFFEEASRAYGELMSDPDASATLRAERLILDAASPDGLNE